VLDDDVVMGEIVWAPGGVGCIECTDLRAVVVRTSCMCVCVHRWVQVFMRVHACACVRVFVLPVLIVCPIMCDEL